MAYAQPELLEKRHILAGFDCGESALDEWLKRFARAAQASGSARVFVATADGDEVAGYYALAAAQVEPATASSRAIKGEPANRPAPAVLLARLAVDRPHQRQGVGRSLLQDAVLRCLQAADSIGVRLILAHAKHPAARAWYEGYGFEPSPTDPLHVMMLMKDLRAHVKRW